jgi:Zn-dependent protease
MLFTLIGILLTVAYLILAVAIHEFAHAFAADRLGDPTARAAGRLTLNPIAHIDPVGTVALPLALMLISGGGFAFGWGKPTPFDPYNLQKPRRDTGIISVAGPISNLLLASVIALIIHFLPYAFGIFLIPFVIVNISLAIFNLIPVGPLDGQKIVFALLPRDLAYEYQVIMNRYGTLILIFLIFPIFGSSPVMAILEPVIRFLIRILLP